MINNDDQSKGVFNDFRNFTVGLLIAIIVVSFAIGFSCGVKSASW